MEGVFAGGGYSLVELFTDFLSVAIHWRRLGDRGWSGWVEGGEAVSAGHFSSKSGRFKMRISPNARKNSPVKLFHQYFGRDAW